MVRLQVAGKVKHIMGHDSDRDRMGVVVGRRVRVAGEVEHVMGA
jgi:hypothetical protein